MQGKQIIKGAVVLGVTLTFTAGTHAHTNQDHLSPDAVAPPLDNKPSPPYAEAPPSRLTRRPPITFPIGSDPFMPTNVRSYQTGTLFIGSAVFVDDGQDGALAPEFEPLGPFTIDVGAKLLERGAFDLFTDERQPQLHGGSVGIPSAVPAPGAIALLGLAALAARRRRRAGLSAP